MPDAKTIAVYDAKTADYVAITEDDAQRPHLDRFLKDIAQESFVLDLGCGPGFAAKHMKLRGMRVDATDASREMVEHAISIGVSARCATFDDLDAVAAYDGIWASFSLLHAAKNRFPVHLRALKRALRPGGRLFLGMKLGKGEERDSLGRLYAYYSAPELEKLLADAGFVIDHEIVGSGPGLDGKVSNWIMVFANG